jgi:hypothetical protein
MTQEVYLGDGLYCSFDGYAYTIRVLNIKRIPMLKTLTRILFFAASAAIAQAHDIDCKGMPVSTAEKMGCCGEGDAHTSADGVDFTQDKNGHWFYRGYPVATHNGQSWIDPLPSTDGCWTIWYRYRKPNDGRFMPTPTEIPIGGNPDDVAFYCIEIPVTGMR